MTQEPVRQLQIDPALLESWLETLAHFGAWGETGVSRLVYTPEWSAAQHQVTAWFTESGLVVERDAVGNVWGWLPGEEPGPAIVTGSHIDTQKPGGRFDGALGVAGGLLAVRTLAEQLGTPRRTLGIVSLCEEESSRFARTNFWGSRAVAGVIGPGEADRLRAIDGPTMTEVMHDVGLDPVEIPTAKRDDIGAFIELHIEQGPLLEEAGLAVGIVQRIAGYRQSWIELRGEANHAGATPMDRRRDPMAAAAEIISGVIGAAEQMGRPAVTTVGRMVVEPNGRSMIPERIGFTVDARHQEARALARLLASHEHVWNEAATRRGIDLHVRVDSDRPPAALDPELIATLESAAAEARIPVMPLASGAVHDAMQFAAICPAAMVFVRSQGGISHSPAEYTSTEDATAGVTVLAAALQRLAY